MSIEGKSETKITVTALRENAMLVRVNRRLRNALADGGLQLPEDCENDPLVDGLMNEVEALKKRNAELLTLVNYWRGKCPQ